MFNIQTLKNKYFVMRHGESEANIIQKIISNKKDGIEKYGLTENGKKQVLNSILKNSKKELDNRLDENIIIYASDFKRTLETAKIVKDFLNINKIHKTKFLEERFFGDLDKKKNLYEKVWKFDKKDENNKIYNIESPKEVKNRVKKIVKYLEIKYKNKKILLVSHGDPLQILETLFKNISPTKHRSLKHLEVAEIRKYN